jgi:hypothetical protein
MIVVAYLYPLSQLHIDDRQGRGINGQGKGLKVPSPGVSLYYCNFLDTLTEEYDVVFEETATFLEHTWMKHSEKRELRCN